ncbi:hypothetical protein RhiirC2_30987 [Rhizophagus irregularis]|uniref:MYND-type domain-containing protein n=1 Tax=Rhizophagus irregularis TaxID=588596 RepID=A0A2N1NVC2_9GLOM|nr:hypothetical protein RhiirC2_30987 [Rhizophagus irregularis]
MKYPNSYNLLGQLIQLPDLPTTKYCSRCQKRYYCSVFCQKKDYTKISNLLNRQVLKLVGIYLLGFGIRSAYGSCLIPSPFFLRY